MLYTMKSLSYENQQCFALSSSEQQNIMHSATKELDFFDLNTLRRLQNVKWSHFISNETIWQHSNQTQASVPARQWCLNSSSHLIQLPPDRASTRLCHFHRPPFLHCQYHLPWTSYHGKSHNSYTNLCWVLLLSPLKLLYIQTEKVLAGASCVTIGGWGGWAFFFPTETLFSMLVFLACPLIRDLFSSEIKST